MQRHKELTSHTPFRAIRKTLEVTVVLTVNAILHESQRYSLLNILSLIRNGLTLPLVSTWFLKDM